MQSRWTAAFQFVTRFMALGIASASGGGAAWLVLSAARVRISVESRVADALVVYGVHTVCPNSASRTACRWQYGWNTHDLRVAQEVR